MDIDDLVYEMPADFDYQTYQAKYGLILRAWAEACGELQAEQDIDGLEFLSQNLNMLTLSTLRNILQETDATRH